MSSWRPIPTTIVCNRDTTPFFSAAGDSTRASFAIDAHHKFVETSGYLCFVPLLSTYALLPENRFIDPNFNVLDLIPVHVTTAVASGRCHLVLDASSEGDPLVTEGFDHLHGWLRAKNIPRSNVTFLSQNRVLSDLYVAKYGAGIHFLNFDFYVKQLLSIVMADDQAFEAATGGSREQLPVPGLRNANYSFLCMNGAPRVNRVLMLAGLMVNSMLDDCYWSMLGAASNKADAMSIDVKSYRSAFGMDWITDASIEAILGFIPRIFVGEEQRIGSMRNSNDLVNSINGNSFSQGSISIVTETESSLGDVARITEKSVKPFCVGHPAIIFGNPGALRLVRELGFQTFSDLISESYDDIFHPNERLREVIDAAKNLRNLKLRGGSGMVDEICQYNKAHARRRAGRDYEIHTEKPMVEAFGRLLNTQ